VGATMMREGAIASVFLIAVTAMAAAALLLPHPPKLRRRLLPALGFLIVPALFWILHPWKLERSWGSIVLAAWLLAAVAWPEITRRWRNGPPTQKRTFIALGCLAALLHILLLARGPWREIWTEHSPLGEAARDALAYVGDHGGAIYGSSVSASMGPVWKWMLIEASGEAARDPALARGWSRVDFSRFDKPEVVFIDPRTHLDPNFQAEPGKVARSLVVARRISLNPPWEVRVVDLRYPAAAADSASSKE